MSISGVRKKVVASESKNSNGVHKFHRNSSTIWLFQLKNSRALENERNFRSKREVFFFVKLKKFNSKQEPNQEPKTIIFFIKTNMIFVSSSQKINKICLAYRIFLTSQSLKKFSEIINFSKWRYVSL